MAKKSASSARWLKEHKNDFYVNEAKKLGFRGRAAFKLIEIQEKYKIIQPRNLVIDLGSAPGSWSQVAKKYLKEGKIIASDILPMNDIDNVEFIQGDFTEQEVFNKILKSIGNNKINVVLSDMSPNMSGIKTADQIAAHYLWELSLDLTVKTLDKNGYFLIKLFIGSGFDGFCKECKKIFHKVSIKKPKASRNRSSECYLLAHKLKI